MEMKIFCMSDIHGCITEFEYALSLVLDYLAEDGTKLILLGDYIHGPDSVAVIKKIIELQRNWGADKVIALCGNHEDMACDGRLTILDKKYEEANQFKENEKYYISWMKKLPRYYKEGNTIFVHAGIDEEAEDLWEWGTDEFTLTEKYPAQIGKFYNNLKIVAGHIGTATITNNPEFHDIFYDGESHYYIDGSVQISGIIPVLKVDIATDKYYRVTEKGDLPILPYNGSIWRMKYE